MKHLFAFALPDSGLKAVALDDIRRTATNNDFLLSDRTDIETDGPAVTVGESDSDGNSNSNGDDDGHLAALERLKAKGLEMGAVVRGEDANGLFMIWRSPTIGFPNGAYAYVADGKVSLYGRAAYGRRDFGANKAFIQAWSAAL